MFASAAPRRAAAQNAPLDPRCVSTSPATSTAYAASVVEQDACQKSIDLFNFLAPQLGALVAGGSTELGHAGTLGGLGHAGLALRANVLGGGRLPDVGNVGLSYAGAQRTSFGVNAQALALPALDAGIGLFSGVPVGLTRVGGLDLLLSGAYVPSFSSGAVRVDRTGGALQIGYGARLGLLARSRFVPGVAVSYLHRRLPETSITAQTTNGGMIGVTGARVSTDAWRLAAEQHLSILGLSAGVGRDRYRTRATLAGDPGVIPANLPAVAFSAPVAQGLTRTNVYGGASLPAGGLAQLVAEVGRVSGGGTVATYNSFSGHTPTDAYTYASVGVRIGR